VSPAAQLVHAHVDIIVAWSTPALMAARGATSTIPIEGQSLSIDVRWPSGPFEQNPGAACLLGRVP
jgi:hypothetical protein